MKLVINIATRNRPEILLDTIARTLPNIQHPNTVLMVSADDDDGKTIDALGAMWDSPRLKVSIKPREDTVGAKFNRMLKEPADVYLAMVDYVPHITPGFDVKLLEGADVYPDRLAVLYNSFANPAFPQINAMTAQMAEKLGHFYPEIFPYWFIDHWLDDIARMIDRIVYVDIWTLQPGLDKKQPTQEMREIEFWSTLFDASHVMRKRIAADIINSPQYDETPARKAALIRNFPLTSERSIMINNDARARCQGHVDPPWTDRYRSIRAKGVEIIRSCVAELEAEAATRAINQPKLVAA